ncbi:MAG: hypothetical protein AAGF97_19040 [Planctomycetota bacterium]
MFELFVENAWPLVAILAISAVLCVAGALKTGRAGLLYISAALLLLAGGTWALERAVVTPREEVALTLQQIAQDLESNDPDRVARHLSSSANDLRNELRVLLPRITIHRASVKPNLEVQLLGGDQPTGARASFNAVIVASENRGHLQNQHGAFFFEVDFRREDDHWRIVSYSKHDPRTGIR